MSCQNKCQAPSYQQACAKSGLSSWDISHLISPLFETSHYTYVELYKYLKNYERQNLIKNNGDKQ